MKYFFYFLRIYLMQLTSSSVLTNFLTFPDLQQGLPSCLTLKRDNGSQEKHQLHPSLPQLLFRLNEAFAAGGSEVDKANLANSCIRAASSPIGKYRILRFFDLLENNKVTRDDLNKELLFCG